MSEHTFRRRKGLVIPWGYVQDTDDPRLLIPVEEQLDVLHEAYEYFKTGNYSLRELARWVSQKTGRRISHAGLKHRFEAEKKQYFSQLGKKGHEAALGSFVNDEASRST